MTSERIVHWTQNRRLLGLPIEPGSLVDARYSGGSLEFRGLKVLIIFAAHARLRLDVFGIDTSALYDAHSLTDQNRRHNRGREKNAL